MTAAGLRMYYSKTQTKDSQYRLVEQYAPLVKRLKAELAELRARYGDSDELTRSLLPKQTAKV